MRSTVTFALFFLLLTSFPGRVAGAGPGDEGTDADKKILEMAAEIEKRVAAIRGLKLKRPVDKGIYTREQLKGFILEIFEKELPDEKAASWAASLKIFGMIPEEMDLKQTFIDFLVSQVGGFYDPEKKCLNCVTTRLSFIAHIVMAHEILHSFQDQYVDLQAYYEDVEFNNDILSARRSGEEGGGHGILPGSDGEGSLAFFLAGDGKTAFLETRGKDVVVLDNFPLAGDLLGRARSAAWKFRKEEFDFSLLEPVPRKK